MGAWSYIKKMKNSLQHFCEAMYGGGLLSVAFIGLSAMQWIWVVRGWCGRASKSLVPLIGGLLGCFAVLLSGVSEAKRLWWVPFMIDPGSLLMICNAVLHAIKKR
jgi:hypothetical protein